ncbi:putative heat shock protein [Rhypophila sp. PSN 637]
MQACRTITRSLPSTKQLLRPLITTHKMSLFWTPRSFHSLTPSSPSTSSSSGFSSLFRMLDDFEKYAQHHVGSFGGSSSDGTLGAIAPKFDVTERENEYDLQGELPGVPTENIEIEFTDPQTLVVKGHAERKHTEGDPSLAGRIEGSSETKKIEGGDSKKMKSSSKESSSKKESSKEGESSSQGETKYWLSERSYGQFSRVFNFPSAVDQNKVTAKFNNGVLDITVPKMEKQGGHKKIQVN